MILAVRRRRTSPRRTDMKARLPLCPLTGVNCRIIKRADNDADGLLGQQRIM